MKSKCKVIFGEMNYRHMKEINLYSISIKRIVCLSLSVCLYAFAQFSRYRAETLQVGRERPGIGRGGVQIVGVLLRGHGGGRLVGTGLGAIEIVGVLPCSHGERGGRG